MKELVAQAQRIVLYIHGIIGNTESMVPSIQQAKVEVNGQQHSIRELFDLVLTFDYVSTRIRKLTRKGIFEEVSGQLLILRHETT